MNLEELVNSITPEVYQSLKTGIELGKWADGRVLTPEQKEHTMQAVIAYELKHFSAEERSGYVPPKSHSHCGSDGEIAEPEDQPLKWQ